MEKKHEKQKMPECCKPKNKGITAGLLSGIIPHSGCIAIILFALAGVTAANSFFIKFISNKYYIPIIFAASLLIAALSAFFYIRRFEDKKIRSHWKYCSVLFSSMIIMNLIMVYFIFPAAAKLGNDKIQGNSVKIDFRALPCSGHIPLVKSELEKVEGVKKVNYISGNKFEVFYDPGKIGKETILQEDICKEFKAEEAK